MKILLIICGWIFVGLGVIGIFLPVMPTTVFLLIAASCFAKSSERFHYWLLNNKLLGKFINDYYLHRAMPLRAKIIAITMLNLVIGYSAFFAVKTEIIKLLLFTIAVGVTSYLLSIKTLTKETVKN
ncbi:MAG: YbaN family protein [Melioribacteraceae bacterium]|nr:YbaN family protein [Melioribacteraceae bacterium]